MGTIIMGITITHTIPILVTITTAIGTIIGITIIPTGIFLLAQKWLDWLPETKVITITLITTIAIIITIIIATAITIITMVTEIPTAPM